MASTFPRGPANLMSAGHGVRLNASDRVGGTELPLQEKNAVAFIHEVDTNANFNKFNFGSTLS